MKIVAVIPAFNEEATIKQVILSVRPHVHEVVVIDDGSRDRTVDEARSCDVIVGRHLINRGQGAALQTGMELALIRGADIILHFDSDGQHPSHQIVDLLEPIKQGHYDIVLGSRFLDQSSNVPMMRHMILKAGLLFTRLMSGLKITDPQSGFRAIHRDAAGKLILHQDRMAHASELLQLVSRHKLRYKEIPVTIRYTDYSVSKGQKSWGAVKIVVDLIKGSML